MDQTGLVIQRVPITALHQDPANARRHPDANMAAIVASLEQFGQAEPLVVQAGTGKVIGGNGRLQAMQQLGWTECDIVEIVITDLEATALGIALNRTADLAQWDEPGLAALLDTLRAEDALDGTGFAQDDIDELLSRIEQDAPLPEVEDPGAGVPPDNPVSRRGDMWLLGKHRLLCGDSTSADDMQRLMGGQHAALMATDPPYCVDYTGADRPQDSGKDWSAVYNEVDIADLGEFLDQVLGAVLPHLQENAGMYIWHAHLQYPAIDAVLEKHGVLRHQPIIWSKPSSTFGYSYYRWAHETCIFGWRKGHKPPHYLENNLTTVWGEDWEGKARISGDHPTQKPLRLFEIPMEQHTKRGDLVLEPFSGSGSQLIAAERLGRRCCAMEISPAFVDVAIRRWQEATKRDAVLDGTGETYRELTASRAMNGVAE